MRGAERKGTCCGRRVCRGGREAQREEPPGSELQQTLTQEPSLREPGGGTAGLQSALAPQALAGHRRAIGWPFMELPAGVFGGKAPLKALSSPGDCEHTQHCPVCVWGEGTDPDRITR